MNISPSLAALAGAGLVAVLFAFVLRPAQLQPRAAPPVPQPTDTVRGPAPERPPALVYVAGAVRHPGVYPVASDARARDALAAAGGATNDADLVAVNLAAHVADGDEIAVPREGEAAAPASRSAHRRTSARGAHRARRRPRRAVDGTAGDDTPASAVVNINTADEATLAQLPGVGATLAERIVAFRTLNGPFASVDGLADVAGITPRRLDDLNALVTTSH